MFSSARPPGVEFADVAITSTRGYHLLVVNDKMNLLLIALSAVQP